MFREITGEEIIAGEKVRGEASGGEGLVSVVFREPA